ncbi:dethiobiotin synthase [Halomonas huangheensis]|nr:dethiobiotin synthase [Halomonas huangheensis]ALM54668.1 dethiobiotin synthetase [Halomonas huangheensis]
MRHYFITGTDTDAGKTLVASALLARARLDGLTTLGLKPVASGCEATAEGLRNADALSLMDQTYPATDYATINPHAFEPAIAPHLAAQRAGCKLDLEQLTQTLKPALEQARDLVVIEGAGGWRVPLNTNQYLAELASRLELPVILVVGLKLGCLNHAQLTAEAIKADGLELAGWVGNLLDPGFSADEALYKENLDHLTGVLPGPCLGIVPRISATCPCERAKKAADYLHLPIID